MRDVRYRVLDPFLRFWFRFVYPHTSRIAQLGGKKAAMQIVKPELESYFGSCYEALCREALPKATADLRARIEQYPNPSGATLGERLFVRLPSSKRSDGMRLHSLDELYRA